jgi:hypothetical protein
LERIEPVHESAMRMAQHLSGGTIGHPGVAQLAKRPGQISGGTHPQVNEALERLMGGMG